MVRGVWDVLPTVDVTVERDRQKRAPGVSCVRPPKEAMRRAPNPPIALMFVYVVVGGRRGGK